MASRRSVEPSLRRPSRRLALLAAGAAVAATLAAAAPAADDPWTAAAELRFNAARAGFASQSAPTPADRLGHALALLNVTPKTRTTTAEARRLLTELATADPLSDVGLRARYFLGRIAQVHDYEPNFATAAQHYRGLIDDAPAHPYAQLALVKYVLVRLYTALPADERSRRFAELEALAPLATHPIAVRDYHYAMGVAHLALDGSEERALQHLLRAEAAGIAQARTRATVYTRIAELARRQAQTELAVQFYHKFLAEFPQEGRATLIRERLAALGETAFAHSDGATTTPRP
jgi:hypothetical protein